MSDKDKTTGAPRSLDGLVRQPLSTRIKRRLAMCKTCEGKGHYYSEEFKDEMACTECSDWLSALKQVELLEEIALISLDAAPFLCEKTQKTIAVLRKQTGLLPND